MVLSRGVFTLDLARQDAGLVPRGSIISNVFLTSREKLAAWARPRFLRPRYSATTSATPTGRARMANEAAKKRVIKNREVIGKYRLILLGSNVQRRPLPH